MTDPRIKLDLLRKEKGWSLSQLAKKLGVSETAVYNWYNEKDSMPTVYVLSDACEVLGTTLSEIFSDAETDRLSPSQLECLELFSRLPERKQRAALEILRALAE